MVCGESFSLRGTLKKSTLPHSTSNSSFPSRKGLINLERSLLNLTAETHVNLSHRTIYTPGEGIRRQSRITRKLKRGSTQTETPDTGWVTRPRRFVRR